MSRNPQLDSDHIVEPAVSPDLFRVIGVAAHNWSSVLIENGASRCFMASTATAQLSEIPAFEAQRLIGERVFRPWNGIQEWAPLSSLPLVAPVFARQDVTDGSGDTAY